MQNTLHYVRNIMLIYKVEKYLLAEFTSKKYFLNYKIKGFKISLKFAASKDMFLLLHYLLFHPLELILPVASSCEFLRKLTVTNLNIVLKTRQ